MRLTLNVKRRWWLLPYLNILQFVYTVTGASPKYEKVKKFIIDHGFKFEVSK